MLAVICSEVAKKKVASAYRRRSWASPESCPNMVPCACLGRIPVEWSLLSINLEDILSWQTIHSSAFPWGDVMLSRVSRDVMFIWVMIDLA